ncbi:MAG TPA: hypothetical protein O0Y06_02455 [Methanocorpusculum sp.]|nr:hypothetical protein [Methanocorpusculum sp.]HJK79746.1 hypothetical protein [Methanocorpusculum sp.]
MKKIVFTILLCALLFFSCGTTAAADDVWIATERMPGNPDTSVSAELSLPDIWIKIDPLPFITADRDNVTFSGTTTIPAGEKILVEVLNSDATTAGPFYGRHGVTHVQNGTGEMQTWSFSINTTTDMPPQEYIIKVSGIETDRTAWERFMIYPAGHITPGPTKASGFLIIPILFAATAAVLLTRT